MHFLFITFKIQKCLQPWPQQLFAFHSNNNRTLLQPRFCLIPKTTSADITFVYFFENNINYENRTSCVNIISSNAHTTIWQYYHNIFFSLKLLRDNLYAQAKNSLCSLNNSIEFESSKVVGYRYSATVGLKYDCEKF